MSFLRVFAALVVGIGCGGADSTGLPSAASPAEPAKDARNIGADADVPPDAAVGSDAGLSWNWCARTGAGVDAGYDAAITVADEYYADLVDDCHLAGLVDDLPPDVAGEWFNYLVEYTYLMTGCPLVLDPVEGGIAVFGLANLQVVGAERPPLGRDDVARLIAAWLGHFAEVLELSETDRSAVDAHLWETGAAQIDAGASSSLSICPRSDAGARDAGTDVLSDASTGDAAF